MIIRYRTIAVGGGVYRTARYIRIPYRINLPTGAVNATITPAVGEILIEGGSATLFTQRDLAAGAGEILIQGGAATVLDENSIAPAAGEILIEGGTPTVLLEGVPVPDDGQRIGSGGELEWFERRNREDEAILAVISEFLKQAA